MDQTQIWIAVIGGGFAILSLMVTAIVAPILVDRSRNDARLKEKEADAKQVRLDKEAERQRQQRDKDEDRARQDAVAAKIAAVSVQIDGLLTERDKAKVKEGEQKEKLAGAATAETLAEGQRQGRELERERAANDTTQNGAPGAANGDNNKPLPVADDRTATASERVATATERSASATEQATSASKKKK